MFLTSLELTTEFDRQVSTLLQKDYPQAAGISRDDFLKLIEPLKEQLADVKASPLDLEKGTLPFVIVVTSQLVDSEKMMSLVEREGKHGVTILRPLTSKAFAPTTEVTIPTSSVYLLVDIDRGKETLNVRPNEAIVSIKHAGRSPLTLDEGIAIVTQYPEFLMKNNCFSLLASRTGKDQRVPAIWINGKKEPNLGWCWDGNPHTWLGSASCAARVR